MIVYQSVDILTRKLLPKQYFLTNRSVLTVSGHRGPWSWRFKRCACWRCFRINAMATSSLSASSISAFNLSLLLLFSIVLLHPLLVPVLPLLSLYPPLLDLECCSWCSSTWCTMRCAPAWYRILQAMLHGFCSTDSPRKSTLRASECCPATMRSMPSSSKSEANTRSASSSLLSLSLSLSLSFSSILLQSSSSPSAPPSMLWPSERDEDEEEIEEEEDEEEEEEVEHGRTHAGHSHRNRNDSKSSFLLLSLFWRRSM